jgi:hypothetical protein
MKHDEEFYFQQIEDAFRAGKGAPLVLSPTDWQLIAAWYKTRIPLAAVLIGIERSFKNFRCRYLGDRIRSLHYCAPEVIKVAAETGLLPDPDEVRAVQEEAGKKLAALDAGADWKTL